MSTEDVDRPRSAAFVVVAAVALLHMLPIGYIYLVSGLAVPGPWLFLLWASFIALAVLAVRLVRRRSWWVAAVPVGAAIFWIAFLTVGEQVLGWQA